VKKLEKEKKMEMNGHAQTKKNHLAGKNRRRSYVCFNSKKRRLKKTIED